MRNIEIFTLLLITGWIVLFTYGCGLKTAPGESGISAGACNDSNACTKDESVESGAASESSAQCRYTPISVCASGDGCCPAGCTFQNDSDCSRSCGNNQVEANESCDPPASCPSGSSCNDNNACTADSLTGSAASCSAKCVNAPISACASGDGCCPSGCTAGNDADCSGTPSPGGYPTGPYGTSKGSTLDNFKSYEPVCTDTGRSGSDDFFLQEVLGAKAVLIVVSSGTCSECKAQAAGIQSAFQTPYASRGLKIVYVLLHDDTGQSGREVLLDYCCRYAKLYGMSGFAVVADPSGYNTGKLFPSAQMDVPLTIVLDGKMKVQYYHAATLPDNAAVKSAIESLL